ncbi:uncharacterized protein [Embiotoca jacksoni]|uniref:uncharacterized protein n=1 Tax=Embiotoca jacksoni TaxID=100190 RepID=UPI0037043E52
MSQYKWAEDDFLPPGVFRLDAPVPVNGKTYIMYHGTTRRNADIIMSSGFRQSKDGMLGRGVYLSRELLKASRYPLDHPESDKVVLKVRVNVGNVIAINRQGHPRQKTWHDSKYGQVFDSAWVPPNCGMVKSGLEENCIWDPKQITILQAISPTPPGVFRLDAPVPVNGKTYIMYHGTTRLYSLNIKLNGFRQSAGGMLGRGVYLSRDLQKASRYPLNHPKIDKVVLKVRVNVGKVIAINRQGHPRQKTWHDSKYGQVFDSAWVPPNCGMVESGLEENCIWDPKQITILQAISPMETVAAAIFSVATPPHRSYRHPHRRNRWHREQRKPHRRHRKIPRRHQQTDYGPVGDLGRCVFDGGPGWTAGAVAAALSATRWGAGVVGDSFPSAGSGTSQRNETQGESERIFLRSKGFHSACKTIEGEVYLKPNERRAALVEEPGQRGIPETNMSQYEWAEDEDDFLPPGVFRLDAPVPVNGKTYIMYHGTTRLYSLNIKLNGFRQSAGGMLGRGVYLSRDLQKASRYPLNHPKIDKVVLKVRVNVGKVIAINRQGHPRQKTWHDSKYGQVFDSAWVPPNCGMVESGLEENCIWDPKQITILQAISPMETVITAAIDAAMDTATTAIAIAMATAIDTAAAAIAAAMDTVIDAAAIASKNPRRQ